MLHKEEDDGGGTVHFGISVMIGMRTYAEREGVVYCEVTNRYTKRKMMGEERPFGISTTTGMRMDAVHVRLHTEKASRAIIAVMLGKGDGLMDKGHRSVS